MSQLFIDLAATASASASALVLDVLLTLLIMVPLFDYVAFGWKIKATEIDKTLTDAAKRTYLAVFQRESVDLQGAAKRFDEIYCKWYGRRRFVAPIILVLLIAGSATSFSARSLRVWLWRRAAMRLSR